MFINNCPDHTSMRTAAAHDHNAVGFSAHSQSPVSGLAPVSVVVKSVKRHNPDSLNTPPVASDVPAAPVQPATEPGLQQVVAMFDQVLSLSNASFNNKQRVSIFLRQANQPRTQQHPQATACRVCSSGDHSTHAHCRLCLNCFNPGHIRQVCPQLSNSPATMPPFVSPADLN